MWREKTEKKLTKKTKFCYLFPLGGPGTGRGPWEPGKKGRRLIFYNTRTSPRTVNNCGLVPCSKNGRSTREICSNCR